MPGGLFQLAVYGSQDFYLTGNPQISFFKSVYRRYTNYAMESVEETLDTSTTIGMDSGTTLKFTVKRVADLVKDIYFVLNLPAIYSSYSVQFQLIKNIGTNIIDQVKISIGGTEVDKHYGEWLNIWHELNLSQDKKDGYNKMICNIPELYDTAEAPGNNGIYPHATVDSTIPSINTQKLYVPLIFWFNQNFGLALPLIALQKHEVFVTIELRPLKDLYTIIETDTSKSTYSYRVKPDVTISAHSIANFITDTSMVSVSGSTRTLSTFDLKAYLEINYIFLDEAERKRFAAVEHEYLIEQTKRVTTEITNNSTSTKTQNIDLLIHHPVKELVWIGRRSDLEGVNDWNNYTNWSLEDIPPYSSSFNDPYSATTTITTANYDVIKEKNIVTKGTLLLNGMERFKEKDGRYFNLIQPYQHRPKISKDGIQSYSFSLDGSKYQPMGSCNMSRFSKIQLQLTVNGRPSGASYDYNVQIYAVNYNVLRIMGGMGGVEFSS